MESVLESSVASLAQRLRLEPDRVASIVALLDEGAPVPYIAQFRQDAAAGVTESAIWRVKHGIEQLRQLETRRDNLRTHLRMRDLLSEDIERDIAGAGSRQEVDQLYAIYKRTRQPSPVAAAVQQLAAELLDSAASDDEVNLRIAELVNQDSSLGSETDILNAIRLHIVQALRQRVDLREKIRSVTQRDGIVRCDKFLGDHHEDAADAPAASDPAPTANSPTTDETTNASAPQPLVSTDAEAESSVGDAPRPAPAEEQPIGEESAAGGAAAAPASGQAGDSAADATSRASTPLSVADSRRKRRREQRKRRRAHLESQFHAHMGKQIKFGDMKVWQFAEMDHGDRVRVLKLSLCCDQAQIVAAAREVVFGDRQPGTILIEWLRLAIQEHVLPDIEREWRRSWSQRVEDDVMRGLCRKLRALMLQRPSAGSVLAIQPANRLAWHLAVLDEAGQPLHTETLTFAETDDVPQKATECLERLSTEHRPALVAIAENSQQKIVEPIVAAFVHDREQPAGYAIVSRDGLEAYAKSSLAAVELGGHGTSHREAIAVGRRVQDPLAEFAKLDARALASGQPLGVFEPDKLEQAVGETKQSCVNRVGVDVNHASESLLRHVAGINELTAKRICEFRQENNAFQNRQQLASLPGISEAAYRQAAGFLRIKGGDCPLDALGIHPHDYEAVRTLLAALNTNEAELSARLEHARGADGLHTDQSTERQDQQDHADRWDSHFRVSYDALEAKVDLHPKQLRRYLGVLRSAGRDIRENSHLPVLQSKRTSSADLTPGQLLAGRVVNIAPFGVFMDLGQGLTGLVHISRLASRYISDPRDEAAVGEWLPVWVVSVDSERGHIALSAIPPGSQQSKRESPRRPQQTAQKNKHQRFASRPRKPQTTKASAPKPKRRSQPAPVIPLTDEMKRGAAPLRTFSDLKQFYDHQETSSENEAPDDTVERRQQRDTSDDQGSGE